ncbi:MAG: hypothetical protein HN846_02170 [Candidatus Pacebacteria bacterium]|jgi:hypothetical protein|nr:hypothetical protein [Candidatus Paceibacterota bacterium]MBT3511722.1 hypothetical protein [Candidatus Paceibacterota bacterium]MBT4005151.1 hypothetical protein [Candidatus Paceibacterota bacterium]MBT4358608.1 hypothetical protein [Candidatus Paceibacterota bacterium]MBT4680748.1 hypothetical protein [Candidatus Paceibacterota bacterium]
MIFKTIKLSFLSLFILGSFLYTLGVMRIGSAIWGDTHYYYAYTKSIVMDRDINFFNEAYQPEFGFPNPPVISKETNRVENIFSPGVSILWIPGFALGQTFSWLANTIGLGIPLNGYSLITQITTGITTVGMGFIGLYFLFLTISKIFSKKVALVTSISLLATTSLLYYTIIDPFNSHSGSFLISAIVLWITTLLKTDEAKNSIWIKLGFALGWLGLIRNQDILLALPIFIWIMFQQNSIFQKFSAIFKIGLMISLVMSIQLITTYYLYGQIHSPYILHGQQLSWLNPDFWRVLFSFNNGIINFSPIIIASLIGLITLIKEKSVIARIGFIFFLLELYVISSWVPEIIGGPYGSRMFTATLPWLGLGLAKVWSWIINQKQQYGIIFGSLIILLFFHNVIRTIWMLYVW